MSGNFSKINYDECYYNYYKNTTGKPLEYLLYSGKYENNLTCDGKNMVHNNLCKINNVANITNNFSTIGIRTDIDSFLKIQSKNCSSLKKNPDLPNDEKLLIKNIPQEHNRLCNLNPNELQYIDKKKLESENIFGNNFCNIKPIIFNPYLGDRLINPNNLNLLR